ncbi:hypothetical protein GCM10027413_27480 [Conyzicola nivalis]|uniref:Uncharacterized protein n=1 Tax=Conyzicola nivalis TaxID=1477021 RepID=A0A916SSV0_9MICO|nr:hypothetical protein GCM10010979_32030 [Conyzicola nivalis]
MEADLAASVASGRSDPWKSVVTVPVSQSDCPLCGEEMLERENGWHCLLCAVDYG